MKLSGRTDIGAPLAFVYEALADFDGWERSAMRRGADVNRTDKLRKPGPGMTWQARFAWRGKERHMQLRLKRLEPGKGLTLEFDSPSVEGAMNIDLVELSARRTRALMQVDIRPRTLAARLFIQSMRLTKGRVQRRFDGRLQVLAQDIEQRFAGNPTL